MNIERPLDFLNDHKGKEVLVILKNGSDPVKGILLAFDIHINIVLEIKKKDKFIRGDMIVSIEQP